MTNVVNQAGNLVGVPPKSAKDGGVGGRQQTSGGLFKICGYAIAAIAVIAVIRQFLKRSAKKLEVSLALNLEEDILDAIVQKDENRNALRAELAAMISSGIVNPSSGILSSILKIEESYEKRAGGKYLRRVSVLRRKPDSGTVLAKVESETDWEYIPDAIRARFIETRGDKVVRLVYDAAKRSVE